MNPPPGTNATAGPPTAPQQPHSPDFVLAARQSAALSEAKYENRRVRHEYFQQEVTRIIELLDQGMAALRGAEQNLSQGLQDILGPELATLALPLLDLEHIGDAFLTARTMLIDAYAADTATFRALDQTHPHLKTVTSYLRKAFPMPRDPSIAQIRDEIALLSRKGTQPQDLPVPHKRAWRQPGGAV